MALRRLAAAGLLVALLAWPARAQHEHGVVDFETSCAGEAAEEFDAGVALLHHMMYDQAHAAFERVAASDESCAIAYWGIAMTQLHPLWAPPTDAEYQRGAEAVAKAREIGTKTEREQAFVDAVSAFFETEGDFPTRLAAWERRQRSAFEAYPDDVDAGAFAALARLAVAPQTDKTFAAQREAGRLLEGMRERAPRHPGLFHYTIHSYDNPVLAEEALEVARGYDRLAPEVPHALHMPSHIFVRVGRWPDVASWNRRSADAALEHPVEGMTSLHYPHAMDYLVYAYLQEGKDAEAQEALDELFGKGPFQPQLATAYALAAAPARYALERLDWDEAARIPIGRPEGYPWERFPAAEAITHFARGIGAARSGDLEAASEAREHLDAVYERLESGGDAYWSVLVDAQRQAVSAWIEQAGGNQSEALTLMRTAADLEDSVDKHPVTPSPVVPARELLGEMLLLADRPAEALEAFEASLAVSRNRLNSLSGAGRAAELAGESALAEDYYAHVIELTGGRTDVRRPRLGEAHGFMAQ